MSKMKIYAVAALCAMVFASGCVSCPKADRSRIKTVAVAEVCTDDGFVRARRTNFDALTAAGFAAVIVPNVADTNLVAALLDRVDALVLTGAIGASNVKVRNKFDFMLMDMAIERGLPIVGFCRGHQVINRYFGGKIDDIPGDLSPKVVHSSSISPYVQDCFHDMEIVPGTRLEKGFGAVKCKVNTSHRFHITELGKGLKVTARSADGVIEAIEHETLPITGFQFHPERLPKMDACYVRIVRDAIEHPAAGK